jgi:hypothetical protein
VDGGGIETHPVANYIEYADGLGGEGAVGARADVEEVVCIASGERDEQGDDLGGGFPGVVGPLEAPGIIQRAGAFPRAFAASGGSLVVAKTAIVA